MIARVERTSRRWRDSETDDFADELRRQEVRELRRQRLGEGGEVGAFVGLEAASLRVEVQSASPGPVAFAPSKTDERRLLLPYHLTARVRTRPRPNCQLTKPVQKQDGPGAGAPRGPRDF